MVTALTTPTLETDRFILRPLVLGDAVPLYPTLADDEQCRYLSRGAFKSVDALGDWLCDPEWDGRSWSAIDRKTGEFVARVVAVPISERQSELGYIVAKDHQERGVAQECVGRLVDYLFDEDDHHRVIASTDPRNVASDRVLEKLGFRLEAHHMQNAKTHIGWCDEHYWAILQNEWTALKERSVSAANTRSSSVRNSEKNGRPPVRG